MYTVICAFEDLKDGRHKYAAGDIYPREGYKASDSRLKELSSESNKLKKPLIVPAGEPQPFQQPKQQPDPLPEATVHQTHYPEPQERAQQRRQRRGDVGVRQ